MYKHRYQPGKMDWFNFAIGFLWASAIVGLIFLNQAKKLEAKAKRELLDPSGGEVLVKPRINFRLTDSVYAAEDTDNRPTKQEVQSYLKTIFGKDWRMAWAVAEGECNHVRQDWPKCKLSWAKEYSVGMFQINIARDAGQGARVHWDKIPGDTLQEKENWLSDWKNNILLAYRIYTDSGWGPWTSYTSRHYLDFL